MPASGWRDVTDFWIRGDLRENYRKKWFIPPDLEQKKEVDALIKAEFGGLLSIAENLALRDAHFAPWKRSPSSFAAYIILVDQFSRHIYRIDNGGQAQLAENDRHALCLAEEFLERGFHLRPDLLPEELVFALMPLRHSPGPENTRRALAIARAARAASYERVDLLDKFIKTSHRKLLELEGKQGDPDDLLEGAWQPEKEDAHKIAREALCAAVEAFIVRKRVPSSKLVFISLSGGVDSMVVCHLLTQLREKHGHFKIVAMHIDYMNRDVSSLEAGFLKTWCKHYQVEIHVEAVSDFRRGVTNRNEYEKQTRSLRYGLYTRVMQAHCIEPGEHGVLVGHHMGDVQENVISNIMKGGSLLELGGMQEESFVNGVHIWRPLLAHYKREIYSYADAYGVPHFKDTTPKWSTRGKLRGQLMPLLEEMFGAGYLQNLTRLAADSAHLDKMSQDRIFRPFIESVVVGRLGVWMDCTSYVDETVFFWKVVLKHVCHNILAYGLVGEKSCLQLMDRLRLYRDTRASASHAYEWKSNFVSLRKDYRTFLDGATLVFLRKEFMRPSRDLANTNRHFPPGVPLAVGTPYQFGPFSLLLTLVECSSASGSASGEKHEQVLSAEPVCLYSVLHGQFEYTIPRSRTYRLVSWPRPHPMRRVHPEICKALPLAQGDEHIGSKIKIVPENAVKVRIWVE